MLECVVNVSEGRDGVLVDALARVAGDSVLDRHVDPDHHRTVLTLAGSEVEGAVRALCAWAVEHLDLRAHHGVHPRIGVVDVVPFVPLDGDGAPLRPGGDLTEAIGARDRFARWAGETLELPCFLYGPERTLPELRRGAFVDLVPDHGPPHPHPTAGACAVGARPALVAYNLWLDTPDPQVARSVAAAVRGPKLRALGMKMAGGTQVSCNLTDPWRLGPAAAYDLVEQAAKSMHSAIRRAELVGLAPRSVVEEVPSERRDRLDLDLERTVEARLGRMGP